MGIDRPLLGQAFFGGYLAGRVIDVTIDRRSEGNENKKKHLIKVLFTEQFRISSLSLVHVPRATLLSNKHYY